MNLTIPSEKIMPRAAMATRMMKKRVKTLEARFRVLSLVRWFISPVKMGMNMDVRAPSPTSLRKRFDILKATKNASANMPAPNT